jgi:photosystem II stability/assembly factor-like uncharacterized protein
MKHIGVRGGVLLCFSAVLVAQEPVTPAPQPEILTNQGKPMVLPFRCTAEDVHWAALSCTEDQPCPVFLELSGVAVSPAGHLFVAGDIHTDSVTLYSTLLASETAGQSWSEVHERIRGASLDQIQFLDAETGWVSGQELVPIPRDPFLLVTSDAGKTWASRPVLNDSAENRFGSVMQFFFTEKEQGLLIVDRGKGSGDERYALFESRNGGESWTIRQESGKPPRVKETPPTTDWRLRVDAASHSFHIERRQGARWNSVAAFAVKLDPCKIAPPPDPGVGNARAAPNSDRGIAP